MSLDLLMVIEYTFFSLKIINSKNIDKNILEISDQNRIKVCAVGEMVIIV